MIFHDPSYRTGVSLSIVPVPSTTSNRFLRVDGIRSTILCRNVFDGDNLLDLQRD